MVWASVQTIFYKTVYQYSKKSCAGDNRMENGSFRTIDDQVIIRLRDRICDTSDRMLTSALFLRVTKQYIAGLSRKQSRLLNIFSQSTSNYR